MHLWKQSSGHKDQPQFRHSISTVCDCQQNCCDYLSLGGSYIFLQVVTARSAYIINAAGVAQHDDANAQY